MYRTMLSDPSVFLAVNDLIASIAVSHHAAINCGRVIETIREAMTPSGADRKRGWEAISQNDFNETINRSWIVMNRFLNTRSAAINRFP